jgi:hypothetical protein
LSDGTLSTWCPKAVALIGELAGTLADRAVVLRMRRRRPDEAMAKLRLDRLQQLEPMRIDQWITLDQVLLDRERSTSVKQVAGPHDDAARIHADRSLQHPSLGNLLRRSTRAAKHRS